MRSKMTAATWFCCRAAVASRSVIAQIIDWLITSAYELTTCATAGDGDTSSSLE